MVPIATGGMMVRTKSSGFVACPQNVCATVILACVVSGVTNFEVSARHVASEVRQIERFKKPADHR